MNEKKFFFYNHLIDKKTLAKSWFSGSNNHMSCHEPGQNEFWPPGLSRIVGTSRKIAEVKTQIRRYACLEAPVLLLGESGTGKDLAARCIHELSSRTLHPFVALNCGAIPQDLMESELFGVEKGAFTGALSHPGKFELSHKGSLFLDEIGEMSLASQTKLLRVLESKTSTRLGGSRETSLDFRIISASNVDLREEMKRKHFRLDLLYRINTLFLEIPPLRERREDIEPLIQYFLCTVSQKKEKEFSVNAMEKLICHNWPGNIRELKSVIDRAVYNSKKEMIRSSEVEFFI